jgi:hypothetical protein
VVVQGEEAEKSLTSTTLLYKAPVFEREVWREEREVEKRKKMAE